MNATHFSEGDTELDFSKSDTIKEELALIFDSVPACIFIKDINLRYLRVNKSYTDYYALKTEDVIGKTDFDLFPMEDALQYIEVDKQVMQTGKPLTNIVEFIKAQNGNRWVRTDKVCFKNNKGEVIGVIGFSIDITKEKMVDDNIRYLSYFDKLTGINNRAFFEEKITEKIESSLLPITVLMGDLNGLKLANDIFGHNQGDKLLVKAVKILKECCPENAVISRWGGDEFAILIYNCDEKHSHEIKAKIDNACVAKSSPTLKISIALGSVVVKTQKIDFNTVLREAEDRMYRNKLMERRSLRHNMISSLEIALSEKSHETEAHTRRVRDLCIRMGEKLSMTDDERNELELLATLHDVGKVGIPDWILEKPGPLNTDEWNAMKKHPEIGYRIAESSPEMSHVALAIYSHHEHYDGKGYPRGLKGLEIPASARILSIVDAYDVMTHDRPYKKAKTKEEALRELSRCAGSQFDPVLVEVFVEIIR